MQKKKESLVTGQMRKMSEIVSFAHAGHYATYLGFNF